MLKAIRVGYFEFVRGTLGFSTALLLRYFQSVQPRHLLASYFDFSPEAFNGPSLNLFQAFAMPAWDFLTSICQADLRLDKAFAISRFVPFIAYDTVLLKHSSSDDDDVVLARHGGDDDS